MQRLAFQECTLSPGYAGAEASGNFHHLVGLRHGEAKFWLEPSIELARNIGLSSSKMREAERLVETRKQEIIDAWNNHFGG